MATILPLNLDNTSTSEPTSETDGALMKTPLKFGILIESIETSASKDSRCLPKVFRLKINI